MDCSLEVRAGVKGRLLEQVVLQLSLEGLQGVKWTRGCQLKERMEQCMGWALFKGMLANSL